MTKKEFKDLCYSFQTVKNGREYSDDFDAYGLASALESQDVYFDDLNSHEALKDWFKHCIDEEYNVGPQITRWFQEGFADFYKVDFSMGTIGSITALATAEDFYDAFEDRFDDDTEKIYEVYEESYNEEGLREFYRELTGCDDSELTTKEIHKYLLDALKEKDDE